MTDKVQKIREWISKTQDGLMDANGNFEYPEHEGAFHILTNLDYYIDSLQEEPVSDDFEEALAKEWKGYVDRGAATVDALEDNTQELTFAKGFYRGWHYKKEEPVSEDLEEAAKYYIPDESYHMTIESKEEGSGENVYDYVQMLDMFKSGAKWQKEKDESITKDLSEYINELSKQFPEVSFVKLSRIAVRAAKWQKENLWKPADGDDLPEIDREVIAILNNGKVVFVHRPPEYWDGKNIITGKVTRNYPKTYGKGGWNIPNVKYWLDCSLPNIEDN